MKKFRILKVSDNWYWFEQKTFIMPWWRFIKAGELQEIEQLYNGETAQNVYKISKWMFR
jgi:hypothetical protein